MQHQYYGSIFCQKTNPITTFCRIALLFFERSKEWIDPYYFTSMWIRALVLLLPFVSNLSLSYREGKPFSYDDSIRWIVSMLKYVKRYIVQACGINPDLFPIQVNSSENDLLPSLDSLVISFCRTTSIGNQSVAKHDSADNTIIWERLIVIIIIAMTEYLKNRYEIETKFFWLHEVCYHLCLYFTVVNGSLCIIVAIDRCIALKGFFLW